MKGGESVLWVLGFLVIWLVLQAWILPKLGVKT